MKNRSNLAVTVVMMFFTYALTATAQLPAAEAQDEENHASWIKRVSVSSENYEGNGYSSGPSITADGKRAYFFSKASNLVDGDANFGIKDVFVRDLENDTTSLVSISSAGLQCRCQGRFASASAGGRFVAFNLLDNQGPGLVPEDDNNVADVYVRDMFSGTTELVSVALDGRAGNDYSSGLGPSTPEAPSLSPDGRYVLFSSKASNLVRGDSNNKRDVFVRDLATKKTERVSIGFGGAEANGNSTATGTAAISNSGRALFYSEATNLVEADPNGSTVDLFLYDLETKEMALFDARADFRIGHESASITADGRYVVFRSVSSDLVPDDTNRMPDVFLRDLSDGSVKRVNVDSQGRQSECPCEPFFKPSISKGGRYVAFYSHSANLVPGDGDTYNNRDIFRHDLETGHTVRLSESISGEEGNRDSSRYGWPAVSDDGRTAFDSYAFNLVAGDENNKTDVFVHE